ncbi:MAG: AAA family ATPase, partial [Bacteroidales bacterium]|nr:AAA family ATPase [Bacteroidales bacterium]
ARLDLFNRFNVELDDGETTPLEQKGSGAQSLVALALAHTISKRTNSVDNFILAVEEPEAHLHPDAIHQLRNILHDISSNNQLIITTHSPLLVNTENIDANVIVSNNQAHAAMGKKEIRDTIGVKASDNLLQADNVVIVEGCSDERILKCLLSEYSDRLKNAFDDGSLIIINAHGCSKVLPLLKWVKSGFCKYHIVFDNDEAGRQERSSLLSNNNAVDAEITLLTNPGMRQSELEDCFDKDIYLPQLQVVFNLTQDIDNILNSNNEKWSARLKTLFEVQGLVWDDKTEDRVKSLVADCIVNKGKQAVLPYREAIIRSLVEKIERMVESR